MVYLVLSQGPGGDDSSNSSAELAEDGGDTQSRMVLHTSREALRLSHVVSQYAAIYANSPIHEQTCHMHMMLKSLEIMRCNRDETLASIYGYTVLHIPIYNIEFKSRLTVFLMLFMSMSIITY